MDKRPYIESATDFFWIGSDYAHRNYGKDYEAGSKYFYDDAAFSCKIIEHLIEYDRPFNKFKRWLSKHIQDILDDIRRLLKWKN